MKVIISGGGTGGHLFPGIAIAEEFRLRDTASDCLFVGTAKGIEARILPKLGWPIRLISAEGIKGRGILSKARAAFKLIPGLYESVKIIRDFQPDIAIGVGGYASAPILMAARLLNVRTAVHEQNALPGMTNRILGKVVDLVFVSFPGSSHFFPERKVVVSGNPLRKDILDGFRAEAAEKNKGRKTLLIFGGSLGAHRINMAALEMMKHLEEAREWKIIHQTGEKDLDEVKESYRKVGFKLKNSPSPPATGNGGMGPDFKTIIEDKSVEDSEGRLEVDVRPFIDDMTAAYREADLVICRAGATTIAELAVAGKPSILVPYPFAADDHQRINAESLVKASGAVIILEKNLTGEGLASEAKRLMGNKELLKDMGDNARRLARPDAAKVIVEKCYELVG